MMKNRTDNFPERTEAQDSRVTCKNVIHSDLLITKNLVYTLCGFDCADPLLETQNAEYGAYLFHINHFSVRFRVSKITPTKMGQFVTLWQRHADGTSQPYDVSDPVDFYVISTRKENHFGQFVFPKHVLCQQNVLSNKGQGGKRAIRVYPPWDKPTSRQALHTQIWQSKYFLEIPTNEPVNRNRVHTLYCTKATS